MDNLRCTKQVRLGSYGRSRNCGKIAEYKCNMQSKTGKKSYGHHRCECHKTSGTTGKKVISFEPINKNKEVNNG